MMLRPSARKGRGTFENPGNRFDTLHVVPDHPDTQDSSGETARTKFFEDHSHNILAQNTSPDIPFTYSLNPYRGCEHGCVYCYARPTHEYLGFSAGLDFETKIVVKTEAPKLLEAVFRKPGWEPQTIALSGNTDCYQPVERKLRLTRRCLQIFLRYRNPVSIITKNALILRDLDILRELARLKLVSVAISVTTLENKLCRTMEPRTSSPKRRLHAIRVLAGAGVPVGVNLAPIIPGLNDREIPAILQAAADAGAGGANYILLRLPHGVKALFAAWLQEHFPERAQKVLNTVRETRCGALYKADYHARMRGTGRRAEMIQHLFQTMCRRLGLQRESHPLRTDLYTATPEQMTLFCDSSRQSLSR